MANGIPSGAIPAAGALHEPGSISVLNSASDWSSTETSLDSLFAASRDASAPSSAPTEGGSPPMSAPLEGASTGGQMPATRPDPGGSQTPFGLQPAQSDAALWQAANSLQPAPPVVPRPSSGGRVAPLDGPTAGLGSSGFGPLISSGNPTGGIVPEYVTSPLIDIDHVASGAESNIPSLFSPSGIRYTDGAAAVSFADLESDGFGIPWGVTRTWTNQTNVANGFSGSGMLIDQLPHLRQDGASTVTEVANGFNLRYFDLSGGVYTARFFVQDALTANTTNKEFQIADSAGDLIKFNDFTVTPANEQGAFKNFIDPNGNAISVTSWTSDGKVQEVQRSNGSLIESELYSYIGSGTNAGLVSNVTLRRSTNGGTSWTTIRQVAYTYYSGEAHGNIGDLKLAQLQDANGNTLDTTYLRYYTGESGGYTHGLKYVFRPESYARLVAAQGSNIDNITDANAAPYANDYFEYDTSQRVTKHTVAGSGGTVGSNGLRIYTYSYTASSNSIGYNSWAVKTTETLPDSNQNIVYTNGYGEIMLRVYHDATSGSNWEWFTKFDGAGRAIISALPSAITGYDETKADLLNSVNNNYQYLSDSSGLITDIDYGASTTATSSAAGNVLGYLQDAKVQQGELGSAIELSSQQYLLRGSQAVNIFPIASTTRYRNTDGTGGETTSYSYTWDANTPYGASGLPASIAESLPVISSTQNGPGSADQTTTAPDGYGRPVWVKDADGHIFYTAFDQASGAVTKSITDVNTNDTGDFSGLPANWTNTLGLELITSMVVDGLGRTTKLTDPDGNITYTVYLDTNYEVRVYPGWQSATNTTTGPTQDYREDRPGSYLESLTMSATPHVTGGAPDGTEAISNIQSLSRDLTNSAGQVVYQDQYFNLSGITYSTTSLTLGTSGTNYYRTTVDYDSRGRQYRTLTPTGTYYKTLYDGLDRPVSDWVGTNDGSPGNMTQTAGYIYDGSQGAVSQTTGVGDSNLTQKIEYPGGSAANRVTNYFYDWRDRLTAEKDGVQSSEDTNTHRPIYFSTLDNLGETTKVQRYNGDTITLSFSGGVPQAPASSYLRAETDYSFDDQMRLYQTQVGKVDPVNGGNPTVFLSTNDYYDHRGELLEEKAPGGLVTKYVYDGARRVTTTYQTDGFGDAGWNGASSVATNYVLTQTETGYDSAGNVIQTVTRQRNHDQTNTGSLGTESTGILSRVSNVAYYYDAANRLTTTADYGTNGGASWTRPSTPDARSDTVLRTDIGYAGDNVQLVQLTGNPTGGTFTLSFGGQTTSPIAYNASASSVQSAFQALSSVGSGNAFVASPTGSGWVIRFAGTLAGSVQAAITGNGSGLTGGTNPSVSITVTSLGGDAGRVQQTTDPRGIVAKTDYDWLGRTVRTIDAFSAFAPSASLDKTTEYTYDGSNHTLTLQADLPSGAYQQTKWVYGVTTAGGSGVNSNDLLSAVQHPDKSSGNPSSTEQDSDTVNALGQTLTATDRNGNVHSYSYDVLGRLTSDQVSTLGSGVDGAVRRLDTAYDGQGNAYLFTSYADTGGAATVNQVQRTFNGFGQLTVEYQEHGGAVNTNTSVKVQYAYTEGGSGNNSRITSITYPNGKVLTYNYNSQGSGWAVVDSRISRLSSLSDTSGSVESLTYLGLDTVVKRAHSQPGVDLTYIKQSGESNGDAGDQYTGLDRFGRVVDQRWIVTSNGTHTDRFKYGYDRDSNRLYRTNEVNHSFDELYHANGSSNGYDNLNQLVAFARGTLNTGHDTISSPSHSITWSLDAAGNFASTTTDGGSPVSNAFNKQNEETQAGTANLAFDNNGNLTTDDTGHTLVYDAWNRLVAYKNGSNTLETYKYDALYRRIVENPGTTHDLYYSKNWQVLEERWAGVSTATIQYVYSPVYIDALVLRDRSTQNNGTLDERLWVQQDANFNVTALVNGSGSVQERYVYDPYGKVTYLNASWNTLTSSAYSWTSLYQGSRLDPTSSLFGIRHRLDSASLGRWTSTDPIAFRAEDINLYRFEMNTPAVGLDPSGEWLGISFVAAAVTGAVGAAVGAAIHVGVSLATNKPVTWHGVAGAAAGGFVGGFAAGAVASALVDPTAAMTVGAAIATGAASGAVGGFLGGGVGNFTAQALDPNQKGIDWGQVGSAAFQGLFMGAALGALGGWLTYRPTYNLGGTGDVPGAVNVQPPAATDPCPPPCLTAPSNQLPIAPGSGNVIVNNSPIAPDTGLVTLGGPYQPNQIANIAGGGGTISVSQAVPPESLPGQLTPGISAVIDAAPTGSAVSVMPNATGTTVNIITPPGVINGLAGGTPSGAAASLGASSAVQGPQPQNP